VAVCDHIPEAPEAIADVPITLASIGKARRQAIGDWGLAATSAAGRHARREHWVCQYHDVTALTGRLLDALRDYR
jgi:hypothetical protein